MVVVLLHFSVSITAIWRSTAHPCRSFKLELPLRACILKPVLSTLSNRICDPPAISLVAANCSCGNNDSLPAGVVNIGPENSLQGLPVSWLACPPDRPGHFHACVGGRSSSGQVWECCFDCASPVVCGTAVKGAITTTAIVTSSSGRFRLMGSADGNVAVQEEGMGR
jgi:hypothetical protein